MLIDAGVPDPAGIIVSIVAKPQKVAIEDRPEPLNV
jgi:hypothetical protein